MLYGYLMFLPNPCFFASLPFLKWERGIQLPFPPPRGTYATTIKFYSLLNFSHIAVRNSNILLLHTFNAFKMKKTFPESYEYMIVIMIWKRNTELTHLNRIRCRRKVCLKREWNERTWKTRLKSIMLISFLKTETNGNGATHDQRRNKGQNNFTVDNK